MRSDPDRTAVADASEEALLLRELCHRTAAEVAAATAAVVLAGSAAASRARARLVDHALARLHGFGELNRLLARPLPARVELAAEFWSVCLSIGHGRLGAGANRIEVDLGQAWTTGATARRLLVVGAGLIQQAVSLAPRDRPGRVRVALNASGGDVTLTVEDDARGPRLFAPGSDVDRGLAITAELVGRGDGTMTLSTGRRGTRVVVTMPTGLEGEDESYPF